MKKTFAIYRITAVEISKSSDWDKKYINQLTFAGEFKTETEAVTYIETFLNKGDYTIIPLYQVGQNNQ